MPRSTVAGHPLHPMLVVAPAALIPFGFVLDAMYRVTGKEEYANAAYYSLIGGMIGGVAAATAGVMDYLTVEPGSDIKRTANLHAALNGGVMAITTANVLARKNKRDHRGGSLWLSALSALGVVVSGWFGGRMVYDEGMRVKGVSPSAVELSSQTKLPGDEGIEHAMLGMEKRVTSGGPVLRH
ncbi:MAG TPA: DUF2231 domain-containing protein [Armatimonadota bacterium]|nr:DUF2231 domain-containing protein [Armatimonadota bacterium]